MPLRLAVLTLRQRRLGDDGADAGLLGCFRQRGVLLGNDRELFPGALELLSDVRQAALDGGSRHGPASLKGFTTVAVVTSRWIRAAFASLVLALAVAGCGDDGSRKSKSTTSQTPETAESDGHDHDEASGPCGKVRSERLDPQSGRHVLPGSAEPEYQTDPPTSGAHRPGEHPTGVLPDPVERPVQVALLEAGHVIIQYKDLEKPDFDRVTALATEHVTVAPGADLPAKVVATAWQVKLLCPQVDVAALQSFIETYLKPESAH